MAREKEDFRPNLQRLDQAFPNKEILSISDVVKFTGLCNKTCKKKYSFDKDRHIAKSKLAREMC